MFRTVQTGRWLTLKLANAIRLLFDGSQLKLMRELHVRKLTKKERDFVYALIDDKNFGYRGMIIALSYEGYPVSMIWRKVDVHPVNVRKWIRKFNRSGVEGIAPRRPGRRKQLDKVTEDEILKIALAKPEDLGLHFSTWSLRKLRAYLIKKGVVREISHTQLMRVLKSRGLKFRKSKQQLISEDPEYGVKKARIRRLLKKPNCKVLFEDEMRIVAKRYSGYEWCFQARIVKKNQRIKGKEIIFAALDPHEHKLHRKYLPNLSKESFCKFLRFLESKFNEDIYLVLDNHRTHTSKKAKEIFENGGGLKPVWLPTHSPELNAVDAVFSLIQREVLNNRDFASIEEVESAIDRWIRKFNAMK